MNKKTVPVHFPQNIAKCSTPGQAVPKKMLVWCLLCDGPIRSENDIMPTGNTPNCTECLRLEF
jgi:hypothetical protein